MNILATTLIYLCIVDNSFPIEITKIATMKGIENPEIEYCGNETGCYIQLETKDWYYAFSRGGEMVCK